MEARGGVPLGSGVGPTASTSNSSFTRATAAPRVATKPVGRAAPTTRPANSSTSGIGTGVRKTAARNSNGNSHNSEELESRVRFVSLLQIDILIVKLLDERDEIDGGQLGA